jgi:hypothetical protein
MTPTEIMREFARDDIFPKAAMAAARDQSAEMTPLFVDMIERLGTQPVSAMKDDEVFALIPVIHLMGEWRAPGAYRPVVRMMRQPTETLDYLLGDAVTETSFRVIAGTFDGDLQPLFDGMDDPEADEFARGSLMSALVLIAHLHPEHRAAIKDHFRTFRSRCPDASPDVLTPWMDAVADLGLEDMTDDVRMLFETGVIPADYCDFSHFLGDLKATQQSNGAPSSLRYRRHLITDAIDELSRWYCYTDAFFEKQKARKGSNEFRVAPWTEAVQTLPGKPGRNDPCFCGSGKKFKKCCLH